MNPKRILTEETVFQDWLRSRVAPPRGPFLASLLDLPHPLGEVYARSAGMLVALAHLREAELREWCGFRFFAADLQYETGGWFVPNDRLLAIHFYDTLPFFCGSPDPASYD